VSLDTTSTCDTDRSDWQFLPREERLVNPLKACVNRVDCQADKDQESLCTRPCQ
jgi:hypothetical protein